jgi:MoaA/NifB/PqqE/SkfB family radical SAM enzyme
MKTTASPPPAVSVVVPVYNGAATLDACLDALEAALPADTEVIVVDDGSTDATPDLLAQRPWRVIRHDAQGGTSAARNTGWRSSRGDVVVFLDADMVVEPTALRRMLALLEEDPSIQGVNGFVDLEPGAPGLTSAFANTSIHYQHRRHGPRVASAYTAICALRRDVLRGMGGWDERWFSRYADDVVTRFHLPQRSLAADPHIHGKHLKAVGLWGLAKHRFNVGWFFVQSVRAHSDRLASNPGLALLSYRYPLSTAGAALGLAGLGLGPLGAPLLVAGGTVFLGANLPFTVYTLRKRGPKEAAATLPLCGVEAVSYLTGMGLGLASTAATTPHGQRLQRRRDSAAFALRYLTAGLSRRRAERAPLFLTVFVTQRCHAACGHCLCGPAAHRTAADRELRLQDYRRMASRLPPTPKLIITGGEPFLREDLAEITAAFHDGATRSRQITIPTTGWHTDRILAFLELLLPSRPKLTLELQLSIDGVGEEHDAIRGSGAFDRLMHTWRALHAARARFPGLVPRFVFTFSAVTQRSFERCFRYVTETLGCDRMDMVLVRGKTADPAFPTDVDLAQYQKAATMLQGLEDRRARRSPLGRLLAARPALEREIITAHAQGKPMLDSCTAGSLVAVITETGELKPCELRTESFGNLRDVDFDLGALWHSSPARAFRDEVKAGGCYCTFETTVRTGMSFEPRWMWRLVKRSVRGGGSPRG